LFAFQTTCINGCKSNLFFKPPATAKPAATCSLPCGGGPGRGHSPSCGNLSQQLNRPNTSLAACCPLSSPLPQGERTMMPAGGIAPYPRAPEQGCMADA
ncbi:TPA: hypothetical protein ACFB7F_002204, partial [Neisseria gonorrhoeae]